MACRPQSILERSLVHQLQASGYYTCVGKGMCHILNPVMITPCVFFASNKRQAFLYGYNTLKRTRKALCPLRFEMVTTGNLVNHLSSENLSHSHFFISFMFLPQLFHHLYFSSSDPLFPTNGNVLGSGRMVMESKWTQTHSYCTHRRGVPSPTCSLTSVLARQCCSPT